MFWLVIRADSEEEYFLCIVAFVSALKYVAKLLPLKILDQRMLLDEIDGWLYPEKTIIE